MPFAEDLGPFFSLDTPGSTTATVQGGGTAVVLFDNGYASGLGGLIEGSGPQCQARSADVSTVIQGSTITINAVVYTVTGVQPDGTGVTTLQLRG